MGKSNNNSETPLIRKILSFIKFLILFVHLFHFFIKYKMAVYATNLTAALCFLRHVFGWQLPSMREMSPTSHPQRIKQRRVAHLEDVCPVAACHSRCPRFHFFFLAFNGYRLMQRCQNVWGTRPSGKDEERIRRQNRERERVCAEQRISKRDKDIQCYESPEQKPPHKAVWLAASGCEEMNHPVSV